MSVGEALKKAIRSGNVEDLEESNFQNYGLDINSALGSDGYSALHWACHYGRAEVLQRLMELGADIHQCTQQGWTGAHICAIRGCTTCLNILCGTDIDLFKPDSRGYMCIHLAAAHGKTSALQALIKTGVNLKVVDKRGWTILHHAAYHGRLNVLQVVVGLGLNANATENNGNAPAHFAAMEGHLECLKLFVYHNNQPFEVISKRNNDGATPKDLATQFQKQDCIDFLASAENEVEIFGHENTGDEFPGHTAASEGNVQLLGMLLVEGHCHVNDQDSHGSTAAHKAAGNGHLDCLQLLIDHGANTNIQNSSGDRPKDVAKRYAQLGCLGLLTATDNDPLDNDSEDEKIAQIVDTPTPQAVTRAGEKVEELQRLLNMAKTHYRQLGGELPEDRELELMKVEHRSDMDAFEAEIARERERREELESELDQMRKRLRESLTLIEHYQSIDSTSFTSDSMITLTGTTELTPEHNPRHSQHSIRPKSRSSMKPGLGGAYVRIGHV
ncbi:ankyrin repeat domain-containing protein 42-like [Halichondria panicea]|uniref:ankyrin repeat domain-containing protein 42-like n=1 Tax=Halichondria panicea TaxID=6063 RepID=UPI00312B77E7